MRVVQAFGPWGRASARAAALALALACGGCVEQAAEVAPDLAAQRPLDRREGVSLADATVSIVSVQGAPASVASAFGADLDGAARARDIVIVDAKKARYLVKGYLSATATQDGADIEYVWDVFGPDKRREFRLNDVISVKGSGDDPWALATPAALESVAGKSADDLAAFLSNSPEAKPAASAAAASQRALGYAAAE